MAQKILLPDTLAGWEWPRRQNPHYAEVKKESESWAASFGAFSPEAQAAFNKCDFNLLASLAYPDASKDHLRTGCDLMNLFFVIDETTDVSTASEVRVQIDAVMDALRDPDKARPDGEWVGAEVARQFWHRARQTASVTSQRRFLSGFADYLEAVATEAEDRTTNYARTVESFLQVRRATIGTQPSFALCELAMDLPDEVFDHPVVRKINELCTDMICIGNDLVSYNKEQAAGDDSDLHNIVTVIMKTRQVDVQGAMNYAGELHADLVRRFQDTYTSLPKWSGDAGRDAATYIDALGNWVRASDAWSFETPRYFGDEGPCVRDTREFVLRPKKSKVGRLIGMMAIADKGTPGKSMTA